MLYRQPRRGDSAATSSQTGLRERCADASQQIFTAAADACSIGRRSLTVLPCYGRACSRSWRHAASWTFNTKTSAASRQQGSQAGTGQWQMGMNASRSSEWTEGVRVRVAGNRLARFAFVWFWLSVFVPPCTDTAGAGRIV